MYHVHIHALNLIAWAISASPLPVQTYGKMNDKSPSVAGHATQPFSLAGDMWILALHPSLSLRDVSNHHFQVRTRMSKIRPGLRVAEWHRECD